MLSEHCGDVTAGFIPNIVTLTAQAVFDAKEMCQTIRKREAQQLRNDKAEATKQRLDPANDPHGHNFYQHIKKDRTPPTTTLWDERNKGYTSNTNRIIELVEEAWRPVFNRHIGSQPSWAQFDQVYGQYFDNWTVAPTQTPKANDMLQHARKMREHPSPGIDG